MFNGFRLGLSIFTTHLTYICPKCPFKLKITISELALCGGNSVNVICMFNRHLRHMNIKCVVNEKANPTLIDNF